MIPSLLLSACLGAGLVAEPPGFVFPPAQAEAQGDLEGLLDRLSASNIQAHVAWLADPAREGRGLGTAGLEATAQDLVRRLRAAGLAPLGSAYTQRVPLRRIQDLRGEVTFQAGGQTRTWRHVHEVLLPEMEPQSLRLPLVAAGHGLQDPALGHDDLKGLEVRGRAVLIQGGLPAGPAWERPEVLARHGGKAGLEARIARLEALGARLVIVADPAFAEARRSHVPEPFFRAGAGVPWEDEVPVLRVDPAGVADLAAAAEVRLAVRARVQPLASRNLLAVLPGTDPALPALLVGAHMDHLGIRRGQVHPGADDNASGVSALMEVARVLGQAGRRPRRTVIMAFWTGEEEGKFGSGHYVRHPRWPLARTFACVNLDMIGHAWTPEALQRLEGEAGLVPGTLREVNPRTFAEVGFSAWTPVLGDALARAGRATGMVLHLDPGEGLQGGSDYRPFARRRVPWIRFFGDFFPGYHTPRDTPEGLEPGQVHRMARLVLATLWELAWEAPASE